MPSIFDTKASQLEPVKHINQDFPVMKIVHLRESLFLVAYVIGRIELLDLDNPEAEPLLVFQVPNSDVPEDDPDA